MDQKWYILDGVRIKVNSLNFHLIIDQQFSNKPNGVRYSKKIKAGLLERSDLIAHLYLMT